MPYKTSEAQRAYSAAYREKHREENREYQKRWYQDRKDERCERAREYNKRHRDEESHDRVKRNKHLRATYGITIEDYDKLVVLQCGACAICGVVPSENPDAKHNQKRLNVDHDHLTGKVRGLICVNCNRGLGCFKDNSITLANAASYLAEAR